MTPQTLATERLALRPYRLEDVGEVFAFSSDGEYSFFALPAEVTRADVEDMIRRQMATPWSERPRFAIILRGSVIGDIGLRIDGANGLADLGYGLAREHWGKGLTTEAATAVVDYGFTTFALAKIYARIDPRNLASVRVAEKLGMTREGLLRSHVVRRGERVDRLYFGIPREEWLSGTWGTTRAT